MSQVRTEIPKLSSANNYKCAIANLKTEASLERKFMTETKEIEDPKHNKYVDFENIWDFVRSSIIVGDKNQIDGL